MSKEKIKERIKQKQNGICVLTLKPLSELHSLTDTDRVTPKQYGGTYDSDENVRIVRPVAHMVRHGNLREREAEMHELKKLIDGRRQLIKQMNSANNRLLAMKRQTDDLDEDTVSFLKEEVKSVKSQIKKTDVRVVKQLKRTGHPMYEQASNIKGIGTMTIAYMLVYIEISKAQYASSLWSYVGFDKPNYERYEKGVAGGGNKTLRTMLYTTAESFIKSRNVYRDVYDREKAKLENSEKKTWTRNTKGKWEYVMWKETKKSHRHGAAIRKMLKHFLADWWYVHRKVEGLETPELYVVDKMGHKGIIKPQERGWAI